MSGGVTRISIVAGDISIDLSGAESEVDAKLLNLRNEDAWSVSLARVRDARGQALQAAVDAAV